MIARLAHGQARAATSRYRPGSTGHSSPSTGPCSGTRSSRVIRSWM